MVTTSLSAAINTGHKLYPKLIHDTLAVSCAITNSKQVLLTSMRPDSSHGRGDDCSPFPAPMASHGCSYDQLLNAACAYVCFITACEPLKLHLQLLYQQKKMTTKLVMLLFWLGSLNHIQFYRILRACSSLFSQKQTRYTGPKVQFCV